MTNINPFIIKCKLCGKWRADKLNPCWLCVSNKLIHILKLIRGGKMEKEITKEGLIKIIHLLNEKLETQFDYEDLLRIIKHPNHFGDEFLNALEECLQENGGLDAIL